MPVPNPAPIVEAWGASALPAYIVTPIPNTAPGNAAANVASFDTGFPPVTFQPLTQTGQPFRGEDFNGILNMLSAYCVLLQGGQFCQYDANVAAAIGGYAKGAVLLKKNNLAGLWINLVANNATDPDAGVINASWISLGTLPASTVAQLPAAGITSMGTKGFVTDATVTTFASVVAGSGANAVPVYCDTANWRIG